MHAVGYRPRSLFLVLGLVTLIALGAFAREHVTPRRSCQRAQAPIANTRALADRLYREHRFEDAARILQLGADREPVKLREELYVIASFYRQLDVSYAHRSDRPSLDLVTHLDWALQFDAILGGAHTRELEQRRHRVISTIGPE
ncbi:MAG: hypothetical protein H0V17_30685 [Deltaproteobacteria bacterium]|nr:hypothetical protein [Deltaproteobacteria bacterium]